MTVRTRFAPSPTGHLHIGGVRTALFSYLLARGAGGEFVLRIEDTDRQRSSKQYETAILEGMSWLGLTVDLGPYYQSQRMDRYAEIIEQLMRSGHAYHCYCTQEELAERREAQRKRKENPRYDGRCRHSNSVRDGIAPVVRFRNPGTGSVVVDDLVQGHVAFSNEDLDDLIIARSDGSPTYNLTVVVDDIDMRISHVLRGDDHLSNTPRQINIMRALEWEPPRYGHVPMLLGEDGARLSKRHGALSVLEYRDQGILPEALLNYLVRLGWSHGDQELFTMDDMVAKFDVASVNKSASTFNPDKLAWLNQHYIKHLPASRLAKTLATHYADDGIDTADGPALEEVVELFRERANTMVEMARASRWLFLAPAVYDAKASRKFLKGDAAKLMTSFMDQLNRDERWTAEAIDESIKSVMSEHDTKMGAIAQPVRVAVTGGTVSPPIGETLAVLGKEESVKRLTAALAYMSRND